MINVAKISNCDKHNGIRGQRVEAKDFSHKHKQIRKILCLCIHFLYFQEEKNNDEAVENTHL